MLMGTPSLSLGNPIIKYDSKGNVIEWTATQPIILDGKTYIDTGFIPFKSYDFNWELKISFEATNVLDSSYVLCSGIYLYIYEFYYKIKTSFGGDSGTSFTLRKLGNTVTSSGGGSTGSAKSNSKHLILGGRNNAETVSSLWKGKITEFSVKVLPNTEKILSDQLGAPKETYNADGNIFKYEFTKSAEFSNSGINTNIGIRDNFKLHMKVTPASGNANYATLIHALYEETSGDYRGIIIRKRGVSSITRWWRLIVGSDEHNLNSYMTDNKTVTIDITQESSTWTVIIDGTTVNTSTSLVYDNEPTIWIGSDSGGNNPVKATIEELTIEKI